MEIRSPQLEAKKHITWVDCILVCKLTRSVLLGKKKKSVMQAWLLPNELKEE